MRNFKITTTGLSILILLSGFCFNLNELSAQTKKKDRARINADYVKVVGGEHYLNIKASARIDRKTVELADLDLTIYQLVDEEEVELGVTRTNSAGLSKYIFKNFNDLKPDSLGMYHILVGFDGNESFRKASREVDFKDVDLTAEWIQKDSLNYIRATLVEKISDSALMEMPLKVRVERIFRPLTIGEDYYETDEMGQIEVEIEDGIPGVDGNLNIEVVLSESDDYGTVISKITAPVGTVIVDESTYDSRTMWSPRGKTPYFLLGVTYSFIIVVWGLFIYLFINLVRIFKS
ncbi:hypothetical protein LCM02_03605 [Lutimonas saemankumensis]|uniref:hypothetical protein n=1 Tax=Lutimonas saemankumensis TaxID=483016 RepID=UPI001CD6B1C5|nr:hypothetical protein [Lutimonas saemankumensis]MCA0931525.1 hypothetical protein [Lutimonas saemankumensis]